MNKILDDIDLELSRAKGPDSECVVKLDYVTYPYDLAFVRALDAYAHAAGVRTMHVTGSFGFPKRHRSVMLVGTRGQVRRSLSLLESMMETRVQESSWVNNGT